MKKIIFLIVASLLIATPCYSQQISRHIEPETVTQSTRIIADGGTVIDQFYMNQVIRTMKEQGIYSSAKFIGDANIAVKKDGSNAVSKLYDISGNNNDAVQPTGANQPIWTAGVQNGKAGLYLTKGTTSLWLYKAIAGLSQPEYVFYALRQNAWNGTPTRYLLGSAGTDYMDLIQFATAGSPTLTAYAGGLLTLHVSPSLGQSALVEVAYSGASSFMVLNGNPTSTTNIGTSAAGGITIGNVSSSGIAPAIDGYAHGVILLNALPTTAQRQPLDGLFNSYYAIY